MKRKCLTTGNYSLADRDRSFSFNHYKGESTIIWRKIIRSHRSWFYPGDVFI